jgi:hypothetical protein
VEHVYYVDCRGSIHRANLILSNGLTKVLDKLILTLYYLMHPYRQKSWRYLGPSLLPTDLILRFLGRRVTSSASIRAQRQIPSPCASSNSTVLRSVCECLDASLLSVEGDNTRLLSLK